MTTCTACGYGWGGPPGHPAVLIGGFPDHVSRLLLDLDVRDGDGRLRARSAAEVWSPLEYLAHTGDAMAWYAERIQRLVNEDRPASSSFDWDAHTANQRYHERQLSAILAAVRGTCASLSKELGTLAVPAWCREGFGSDGSVRTVAQLADRAAHEAHHHLRGIALGLTSCSTEG